MDRRADGQLDIWTDGEMDEWINFKKEIRRERCLKIKKRMSVGELS